MNELGWLFVALYAAAAAWCIFHALLHKQEPQAAMGWIGICLFMPLVGVVLYVLFGINRVQARARELGGPLSSAAGYLPVDRFELPQPPAAAETAPRLHALHSLGAGLTGLAMTSGNRVHLLPSGESAYAEMIAAIDRADTRVWLSTYIFESDETGKRFVAALARARDRGVDVRVIVDGLGRWYSLPPITRLLRAAGLRYTLFLPPRLVPPSFQINLRNHRKLLIIDGDCAFTGGMNIGGRHLTQPGESNPRARDVQFLLHGAIAAQMAAMFIEDWRFCTKSGDLSPPAMAPDHSDRDDVSKVPGALCRVIADGPNDEVDKLIVLIIGCIALATHRVVIATPYFLPTRELIGALQSAAMRGIDVTVLLPERNNLPYVHWASRHIQARLLKWGVHILYSRRGFDHSKLLVVDDDYLLIGSPNLDERSLRLNFELAIEIIDTESVAAATAYLDDALREARRLDTEELESRVPIIKVRDAACWLFSPYL